jgi:hypothetical protein
MNELHFAYKIRQQLNRGLHEISPETTDRLAAARRNALSCQKQPARLSLLSAANGIVHFQVGNQRFKHLATSIVLVLGVVFSAFWMADQRVEELGTIDSALLADDLPIAAFTDKGFDAWLKSTAPR